MDYETIYDDEPRYKSKKKKKKPKKADHKHDYEEVVFCFRNKSAHLTKEKGFIEGEDYCLGKKCKICGKEEYTYFASIDLGDGRHQLLCGESIPKAYPRLPIVYTANLEF